MRRFRAQQTASRGYQLMVIPLFLFLFLITGIPLVQAVLSSFYSESFGIRTWIGLQGYRFVIGDPALRMSINITLLWGAASIGGSLLCAYLLAEKLYARRKRAGCLFAILLPAWIIPIFISIPLWRAMLYGNGGSSLASALTGASIPLTTSPAAAFWISVLVSVWLSLPFPTIVIYSNLQKINRFQVDAAIIDGCSRWELNRYLYLPSLREPALALTVLSAIGAFKEFTMLYLLTAGGPPLVEGITDNFIVGTTTTVGIFLYQTFGSFTDYGLTAVFGVFMAAGVLLIMLVWIILRISSAERRFRALAAAAVLLHIIWFSRLHLAAVPLIIITALPGRSAIALTLRGFRKPLLLCLLLAEAAALLIALRTAHWFIAFNPAILSTMLLPAVLPGNGRSRRFPAAERLKPLLKQVPGFLSLLPDRMRRLLFHILQEGVTWATALFSLLILYLLIWLSFSKGNVCSFTGFLPPFPTLSSYSRIFSEYSLHRALLNTLLIALPTAILVPLIVIPGSYALARMPSDRSDRWLMALQTLGTAGGIHTLIPLFIITGMLGLLDTRTVIVIIYIGHAIPRSALILRAFFHNIPHTLHEAASIEGSSYWHYLRTILIPLSLPAVISIMMTSFLSAWNGFLVPLLFIGSETKHPVSITLFNFVGSGESGNPQWSLFAAASTVNLIIVSLLFLLGKRPLGKSDLSDYWSY